MIAAVHCISFLQILSKNWCIGRVAECQELNGSFPMLPNASNTYSRIILFSCRDDSFFSTKLHHIKMKMKYMQPWYAKNSTIRSFRNNVFIINIVLRLTKHLVNFHYLFVPKVFQILPLFEIWNPFNCYSNEKQTKTNHPFIEYCGKKKTNTN